MFGYEPVPFDSGSQKSNPVIVNKLVAEKNIRALSNTFIWLNNFLGKAYPTFR